MSYSKATQIPISQQHDQKILIIYNMGLPISRTFAQNCKNGSPTLSSHLLHNASITLLRADCGHIYFSTILLLFLN